MISITIFAISGTALITLITAKSIEEKLKKQIFLSSWIAKWDEHAKVWYHKVLRVYSEGKEKAALFFNKKIRIHSKNIFNKLLVYLKEKRERYESNMRNSRLLKKPDGISEFFKNMSDIEKGNGSIDETFEDARQNDAVGLGSQNTPEKVK
ncbi:MAG: hypothetical protein HYS51_02205 [Candidatus Zambryskibacteria bacterium]|nr:hypothetical protein [Candidatus Zambryskibacteria bacterium]